jgi:hypothetical protein
MERREKRKKFYSENLKGRRNYEEVGVDGITLKQM